MSKDEEITNWFKAIDTNKDGQIKSAELQSALLNAQGKSFSRKCCDLMLKLFSSKQGALSEEEFRNLYRYINEWVNVFGKYDADNSGLIDSDEFACALKTMGYKLSDGFVELIMEEGRLTLDGFIVVCLQMWKLTEHFKKRDTDLDGVVALGFEDFVAIVLDSCL